MSAAFNPSFDRYESFHKLTTAVNMSKNIEHDRSGKASIINGDIFYSPNSSFDVRLPLPVEENSRIWRHTGKSNAAEFHQPLWWSPETAYLAFLPKHPELYGEPLTDLLHYPSYFDKTKLGYVLDPKVTLRWKRLEVCLMRISYVLVHFAKAVEPRQIIRTAISSKICKTRASFHKSMRNAKNWFSIWMAQVSYAIAASMPRHSGSPQLNHVPEWYNFLLSDDFRIDGWDQAYLSGIKQSMGTFSPFVYRSGIFLRVVSPPAHQFSVDWLQTFNVPVWYPWGKRERDAALTSHYVSRLTPPADKLQAIASFLSKTPSSRADGGDVVHTPEKEPWFAFFAERTARQRRRLQHETPEEKQSRLNRERQPATTSSKVLIWEHDRDTNTWQRVQRTKLINDDWLDHYSKEQKVYDPVDDEWDCCSAMGPDSDDSDDGEASEDDCESSQTQNMNDGDFAQADTIDPDSPSLGTTSDPLLSSYAASGEFPSSLVTLQTPPRMHAEGDYIPHYYNTYQLLRDFFGFVSPLPLPAKTSSSKCLSTVQEKVLLGIVGLQERQANCPSIPISMDVWSFVEGFNSADVQIAQTSLWDLAPGNRQYLFGSRFSRYMHVIDGERIDDTTEKIYLFDFDRNATVQWILAVTNIIDALFICRMPSWMEDYDVARDLLKRGIRFRTLVWSLLPPPRDLPIRVLPFRLSGYKFDLRDYDAYLRDRDALLRNPRVARAALMKGGIIWRLIVASMSIHEVLAGPSAAISIQNYGLALGGGNTNYHYWDDVVSEEELDLISGTYLCFTGYGTQFSRKSWWPPFSVWTANAHLTYWTGFFEAKFKNRLSDIISGNAQPLTATEWRKWVRGSSHSRRVKKNVETASHRYLDSINTVTSNLRAEKK